VCIEQTHSLGQNQVVQINSPHQGSVCNSGVKRSPGAGLDTKRVKSVIKYHILKLHDFFSSSSEEHTTRYFEKSQ